MWPEQLNKFAKMSLFPVPASRLSETLQNNSGKYNAQLSNCETTDLVSAYLFNLFQLWKLNL
jgi:hypothetical protein